MHLEVVDPLDPSIAPIVLLREFDGNVNWCIEATGLHGTVVRSVRFKKRLRLPFVRKRVGGTVDWTFGRERTLWLFEEDGTLIEYWYSW